MTIFDKYFHFFIDISRKSSELSLLDVACEHITTKTPYKEKRGARKLYEYYLQVYESRQSEAQTAKSKPPTFEE